MKKGFPCDTVDTKSLWHNWSVLPTVNKAVEAKQLTQHM